MRAQLKRFMLIGATAGLLLLVAGCGGGGDGGGEGTGGGQQPQSGVDDIAANLDTANACTQVAEALTDLTTGMTESAGDADKLNTAVGAFSDRIGEIAAQTDDAELKTKLEETSATFGAYNSDGSPESLTELSEMLGEPGSMGCA